MTRILIRCDSSLLIGSGHVMRCRTLARELRRRGAEIFFLCRRQPGDLIALLEQEFQVLALPEQPLVACEGLEGRDLYGAWLGCTQEQDAAQCIEVLDKAGVNGASWIVADHYGLDSRWEAQLLEALAGSAAAPKLLVIDDLADRTHLSDLLLDQNFFGQFTKQRYQNLLPSECSLLLGPRFSLLGSEYAILHGLIPSRIDLNRVLIYFGAVDKHNLAEQSLALLSDENYSNLSVDLVIGSQSPYFQSVVKAVSKRPRTSLHTSLNSLAGLMARADFSLGAGGATTWERACMGLPSLVIPVAENQVEGSISLHSEGYIFMTRTLTSSVLNQAFVKLKDLSQKSSKLTDGSGCSSVASLLLKDTNT